MFNERTKCPAERKMMSVTASYPTRDCGLTSLPLAVVCKIYVAAKRTSAFQKCVYNCVLCVFCALSTYFATFRTSLALLLRC